MVPTTMVVVTTTLYLLLKTVAKINICNYFMLVPFKWLTTLATTQQKRNTTTTTTTSNSGQGSPLCPHHNNYTLKLK